MRCGASQSCGCKSTATTPLPGFGDSVSDGASGVVAVFSVVLIVVGVLLPFLPIIAVIAAVIWWIRRRIRNKESSPPSSS